MNDASRFLLACTLLIGFAGCRQVTGTFPDDVRIHSTTTTGMIGDAVSQVAGTYATVKTLIGPGVDPHLFKASHGDLQKLTSSDIVFYNGLHLEGKMSEVLHKLSRLKPTVAVADGLPDSLLLSPPEYPEARDPHIWFDLRRWSMAVAEIERALCRFHPEHCNDFRTNAARYRAKLDSADVAARRLLAAIPPQQRVLITAHDAFGYFGNSYGVEVRGLQGLSTLSDFGLRDVTTLVDFIVSRRIKAIFVETSVSPRAIRAVQEGCRKRGFELRIGGSLYSDAMGEAGTPAGTYLGMFHANVLTITGALSGAQPR